MGFYPIRTTVLSRPRLRAAASITSDLFTVDKDEIKDLQIVSAVAGGTTVYKARHCR